ncbi:MAG: DinB family protein [Bacteroidota bacterium]
MEKKGGQIFPTEKLWTEIDRQYILAELDRTTKELLKETQKLGFDQWTFREHRSRWNINEIVEHLILQNELHYREISAVSNGPALPKYLPITSGKDGYFKKYATDPTKGQAKWFLQPLGRFESKRESISAFQRACDGIRGFVETTDVDLRKKMTFRNKGGEKKLADIKIGDVRDLHQLLLTGVAHTDRHLMQIRNIKKHPAYPRNI